MQTEIVIMRDLPPELLPEVVQHYWQAFGGKLGRTMGPEPKALRFFEQVLDHRFALAAVAPDGRLLGVAGFKTIEGAMIDGSLRDMAGVYGWFGAVWRATLFRLLQRDTDGAALLMDGIFVASDARGMGVGTALLAAIKDEARNRGLNSVRLDVVDDNTSARRLYEREGFVACDVHNLGALRHVFGFRSAITMDCPVT